jgi:hypothetical protein
MRSFLFTLAVGLLCSPSVAYAQQNTFGRFVLGMTPTEARSASPEQQWIERSFGGDLVVLTAEQPVRIGRLGFRSMLAFRNGALEAIQFQAGGPIQSVQECDDLLLQTAAVVEASLGRLNVGLSPSEFGAPAASRTTERGSEVRFYDVGAGRRAGVAVRRGDGYVEVSSLGGELGSMGLACILNIGVRSALGDFGPLPPPSPAELAAAEEIEPEWTVRDGPDVTEITMPASAFGYGGRVRVRLDCLVISENRVNCIVESEEPQGMQFGDAALAASRFYRIEPMIDGRPSLGKRVRLTIRYELEGLP